MICFAYPFSTRVWEAAVIRACFGSSRKHEVCSTELGNFQNCDVFRGSWVYKRDETVPEGRSFVSCFVSYLWLARTPFTSFFFVLFNLSTSLSILFLKSWPAIRWNHLPISELKNKSANFLFEIPFIPLDSRIKEARVQKVSREEWCDWRFDQRWALSILIFFEEEIIEFSPHSSCWPLRRARETRQCSWLH